MDEQLCKILQLFLVVAIVLFVLWVLNEKLCCNTPKQDFVSQKDFDDAADQQLKLRAAQLSQDEQQLEDQESTGLKYEPINTQSMTGLTSSMNVNSGMLLADTGLNNELDNFELRYRDIVNGEIGSDVIKSQQNYQSQVKNDNAIRYIDNEISSNYTNYHGLSLSRAAKGNAILPTSSTQIQSIDVSEFDSNIPSLRSFYGSNI